MIDLSNSHSLTDFQRNAKGFIDGLNETKEPLILTVNGKVQAVLVDPLTFQQMETQIEQSRLVAALREGLKDIEDGRVRPVEDVVQELKAKYGI